MRYLLVLIAVMTFAVCNNSQAFQTKIRDVNSSNRNAHTLQQTSIDTVVQYLLTSAASDFHAHGPANIIRFRQVRFGHIITSGGKAQYMLCGQFLSAQKGGKPQWTPFATIKTSGYEQYMGEQSKVFCNKKSVKWDKVKDLSTELKKRLDSLH